MNCLRLLRHGLAAVATALVTLAPLAAQARPAPEPIALGLIEGLSGPFANAGVGAVLAVAEWHPNLGDAASERFYAAFRERFPDPRDDCVHVRMQVMVEMLAAAIERAGTTEAAAVARALEGARFDPARLGGLHEAWIRAEDHQLQQPLVDSMMARAGSPSAPHDVEGSGYGFRTVRRLAPDAVRQPSRCAMERPD
jgi:branched-chain amino acid transport system substrate-binding protein